MRLFQWTWIAIVCAGLAAASSPAGWCGEPGGKGKSKKEKDKDKEKTEDEGKGKGKAEDAERGPKDRPPGWDKGKKKGWKDEYPPGWDKKTDEEKAKWQKDVDAAGEGVELHCDAKGLDGVKKAKKKEAVERLSRKGCEVEKAKGEVIETVKNGKSIDDLFKKYGIEIEVGE